MSQVTQHFQGVLIPVMLLALWQQVIYLLATVKRQGKNQILKTLFVAVY